MTTKAKANVWDKLSTILSEVLTQSLDEEDVETVMEALTEKRAAISKLLVSTTRKTKRKKDPNAPKRWKTSYILFCMDKREEVKAENPDMPAVKITAELGARWNALSDKQKKPYVKLSAQDKSRYDDEMANYTPPSDDELEEVASKGRKKKKERTGPKRPLSSYMFFCQDVRNNTKEKNPNMSGKEITSELGRLWKELTDEEKVPYQEQYQADKVRYEEEKAEMAPAETKAAAKPAKKSKKAAAKPAQTTKKSKKSKKAAAKPEPSPKKKAKKAKAKKAAAKTPGYEVFAEEQREDINEEHEDWSSRKVTNELNKRWNALTDEDREAYDMEAADSEEEEVPSDEELSDPELSEEEVLELE
jgi:hypothetical protein